MCIHTPIYTQTYVYTSSKFDRSILAKSYELCTQVSGSAQVHHESML